MHTASISRFMVSTGFVFLLLPLLLQSLSSSQAIDPRLHVLELDCKHEYRQFYKFRTGKEKESSCNSPQI